MSLIRRSVDELVSVADPAWPLVQTWISQSHVPVEVLPVQNGAGAKELESIQVTIRSVLGALAYSTGGVVLDRGWLYLLGCGHERMPWSISHLTALMGWADETKPPGAVGVGVDVLGGVFAINGGAISDEAIGHVHYFDPSRLGWENLGIGHANWVGAMLDAERLTKFYSDLRWGGWLAEVAALRPLQGIAIYPFLWSKESRPIERTQRAAVSLEEILRVQFDMARQLGPATD